MRTIVVCVVYAVISVTTSAQSILPWQWLNTAGGDISGTGYTEQPYSMEVDDSGNVYISGTIGYFAEFDTFYFPGYGDYDVFIAKYSCDGVLQWVHTAGSSGTQDESFLGISSDGSIYWVGAASTSSVGTFYIGDTSYQNIGVKFFLARLEPSGSFDWIKIVGAEGTVSSMYIREMEVKRNEIVMSASGSAGEIYPGFTSTGGQLICKFDLNGNFLGLNNYSSMSISADDIAVDDSGNVYWCGSYGNEVIVNNDTIADPLGLSAGIIVKYDSNLNLLWHREYQKFFIFFSGIACDQDQNLVVVGNFSDTLDYGNGVIVQNGSSLPFMLKMDNSGNPIWAKRSNGITGNGGNAYDVYVDEQNNYYLGGRASGTVSYVTDTFTASASPFYVSYNPSGDYRHASVMNIFGGTTNSTFSVAADANGNTYMAGAYSGCIPYGNDTLCNTNGTNSIFISKYGQANCMLPCALPLPGFSFSSVELTATFTNSSQLADTVFYVIGNDTLNKAPYTYTFSSNGTYSVCQVAQNACGDSTLCQQVTVTTIGLDPPAKLTMSVYPNPVSNELFIQMSEVKVYTVSVMNTTGKVVAQTEISGKGMVSLDHISPGIYFVQAHSSEGNVLVGRVIKE